MKKCLVAVALLFTLGLARAAEAPVFPSDAKVKILRLQLDRANVVGEYRQLQSRMKEIEMQVPQMDQGIEAAIDEAYKQAKIEKKDWNVDRQKLEFVAIPKPESKKP
jgi:hypothetical protein